MNCYEIMLLSNPHLEEKEQKNVIEFVKNYIESNNGKVIAIDSWGKRSTAYPIKHFLEAYYDIIYYKLDPKNLPELERRLKLKESILRYLNLRTTEEKINLLNKKDQVLSAEEVKEKEQFDMKTEQVNKQDTTNTKQSEEENNE